MLIKTTQEEEGPRATVSERPLEPKEAQAHTHNGRTIANQNNPPNNTEGEQAYYYALLNKLLLLHHLHSPLRPAAQTNMNLICSIWTVDSLSSSPLSVHFFPV